MLYFNMAWRNIWRNRRRTLITMLSIIVAVFLSAIMRSMQEGQYDMMIEGSVGKFLGYIQIHQLGYWDDQTLDNAMYYSDSLRSILDSNEQVSHVVPRLNSYALAAGEEQSRPALVLGIDVEAEKFLSEPQSRLQAGSYFDSNSQRSVLIGKEMFSRLNVEVGDSLVLIGQGFRAMSATGLYHISGSVSFPDPQLNKSLVIMPLETAQAFFGAEDHLTSLILIPHRISDIELIRTDVGEKLSADSYEVMSWTEMVPELIQGIQADRGSGMIIILILYMVVGFGILGTVLMMTNERRYEFGVMIAVGTPRHTIAVTLAIELLLLALVASAIGIVASVLVSWYFNVNPIELTGNLAEVMETYSMDPYLPFSLAPSVFINQAGIIFMITLLFSFFPLIKASQLKPVKAMRS
ncbi:ABC transporter permease [Balneola sp. MJW-20]|uniref:ABC transporter permease n=1 Tax=Gracilimonas aurantiaca TaxID=3234185 RepID=UPI0034654096